MKWSLNSWQKLSAKHIPQYNDNIESIKNKLSSLDGFINYEEIKNFISILSKVSTSNHFIVQMGECAELFTKSNEQDIISRLNLIEDFCSLLPKKITPVKIGRIAGQYSKPRSEDFELINGVKTPVYKGDMFHDFENRNFDSNRMIEAYNYSKKSYDIIQKQNKDIFTSHEALNLHYEECVTKLAEDGKYYNLSAHMLWLGEKTRFLESAHVEYLRGIANPVGIKISNQIAVDELLEIIKLINPENTLGKIILINRMGSKNTSKDFDDITIAIKKSGLSIIWTCDPMHGNTFKLENNYKTRKLEDIISEITDFANILKKNDIKFGGIHLENSPDDIYECIDNNCNTVGEKYETLCDPRLNRNQSLEIAKLITKLII